LLDSLLQEIKIQIYYLWIKNLHRIFDPGYFFYKGFEFGNLENTYFFMQL